MKQKINRKRSKSSRSDSINVNNGKLNNTWCSKSWPEIQSLTYPFDEEGNYNNNSALYSNAKNKNIDRDDKFLFTYCTDDDSNKENKSYLNWTLSDAVEQTLANKPVVSSFFTCTEQKNSTKSSYIVKFPITSFNHIAREVLSIEKSKNFYVDILGFKVIPRPPFECEGYWLHGHGYNTL